MGGTLDDFVGKNMIELFGREAGSVYLGRIRKAVETDQILIHEDMVTQKEEDRFYVSTIRSIKNDAGELLGVQIASIDMTEKRKFEIALEKSESKFRSSFEASAVGMTIADTRGNFFSVNQAFCEMLGYTKESLLNQTFADVTHPEDREESLQKFNCCLRDGTPYSFEKRYLTADGSVRWGLTTVSPVVSTSSGKIEVVIGHVQDITDRIKAEDDLVQARKMETIGTLAGGIAHEFNNILGVILGNAELAADEVLKESAVHDSLEEIKTASLRAREVVKQILNFSRKTESSSETVFIGEIIEDTLKLVRATTPAYIRISQELPEDPSVVVGNPTEISQILLNLCSNSAQAIAPEPGTILVSLEKVKLDSGMAKEYGNPAPGEYVRLIVEDSGRGIEAGDLKRVFEPYFTTKDPGEGLGMGLTAVYGLVRKHDGGIRITSEAGRGARAEVLFPLVKDQIFSTDRKLEESLRGNERILFVDDEEPLVRISTRGLESFGYQVTGKTSSTEALEAFRNHPFGFDLVVTDMAMPELAGDRLARMIREIRSNMPVIICSGYNEQIGDFSSGALGVSAYINKPVLQRELAETVRKVLDG